MSPRAPVPDLVLRAGRAIFGTLWDVRVRNSDRVPTDGPVLIAANHLATLDGPLAILWSPHRATFALAKTELFVGILKPILQRSGQISVDRSAPMDRAAIRACLEVLDNDQALVVFPEGRRHGGDFAAIRPGIAYFAMVTGAPVVPLAVLGTRTPRQQTTAWAPLRSRVELVFGEPITVAARPWPRRRADVAQVAEDLRGRLQDHVVEASRATGIELPGEPRVG